MSNEKEIDKIKVSKKIKQKVDHDVSAIDRAYQLGVSNFYDALRKNIESRKDALELDKNLNGDALKRKMAQVAFLECKRILSLLDEVCQITTYNEKENENEIKPSNGSLNIARFIYEAGKHDEAVGDSLDINSGAKLIDKQLSDYRASLRRKIEEGIAIYQEARKMAINSALVPPIGDVKKATQFVDVRLEVLKEVLSIIDENK
jgi:hypothetical protein